MAGKPQIKVIKVVSPELEGARYLAHVPVAGFCAVASDLVSISSVLKFNFALQYDRDQAERRMHMLADRYVGAEFEMVLLSDVLPEQVAA